MPIDITAYMFFANDPITVSFFPLKGNTSSDVYSYDCDRFGTDCEGTIPPDKYRNKIEEYCERFVIAGWRREMFKEGGTSRLSK